MYQEEASRIFICFFFFFVKFCTRACMKSAWTYQKRALSLGQSALAWSTGEPMTVNPSCHIYFGKNGDIRARPYPVAPAGSRNAFIFCWAGRENSRRASDSTSSTRFEGMPWLITWNAPHVSHAWPASFTARGSLRSMIGIDNWSSDEKSSDLGHTCESGTVRTEWKSRGTICRRWIACSL